MLKRKGMAEAAKSRNQQSAPEQAGPVQQGQPLQLPVQGDMSRQGVMPAKVVSNQPGMVPGVVDLTARKNPQVLARELLQLVESGKAPEGFDLNQAVREESFLQLLNELPVAAAVRVYAAENKAAQAVETAMQALMDKLKARADLPQPLRTGAAAAPAVDYMSMSAEDFAALEKRMRQAKQAGKRVLL